MSEIRAISREGKARGCITGVVIAKPMLVISRRWMIRDSPRLRLARRVGDRGLEKKAPLIVARAGGWPGVIKNEGGRWGCGYSALAS